jgi:OOP family OmpA-OmpF porin
MKGKIFWRYAALMMFMGSAWSGQAHAQSAGADLLQLNGSSLRGELQTRYDAALTATQDQAVVSVNDNRYYWASEAKVQCAIAIGFTKSSAKDETSIRKCGDAYARFTNTGVAPPVAENTVPSEICGQKIAGIVFFEFDSAIPPVEAAQTIDFVAHNVAACGWTGFTVAGHTDRAGGDGYNDALSMRRAQAVAALMEGKGINSSIIAVNAFGETSPRVPTPDGERNPQNRRVEITVN